MEGALVATMETRQSESDWNVERFGPERPACRHDFNALVAERDRYMTALERIAGDLRFAPADRDTLISIARRALDADDR